jgi:hypothetical protein
VRELVSEQYALEPVAGSSRRTPGADVVTLAVTRRASLVPEFRAKTLKHPDSPLLQMPSPFVSLTRSTRSTITPVAGGARLGSSSQHTNSRPGVRRQARSSVQESEPSHMSKQKSPAASVTHRPVWHEAVAHGKAQRPAPLLGPAPLATQSNPGAQSSASPHGTPEDSAGSLLMPSPLNQQVPSLSAVDPQLSPDEQSSELAQSAVHSRPSAVVRHVPRLQASLAQEIVQTPLPPWEVAKHCSPCSHSSSKSQRLPRSPDAQPPNTIAATPTNKRIFINKLIQAPLRYLATADEHLWHKMTSATCCWLEFAHDVKCPTGLSQCSGTQTL